MTSEEAFAKACHTPEIFISDQEVGSWASAHNVLNGASLVEVLDFMQADGFSQDGMRYNDGPYVSVDWTNAAMLQNAIATGPVKIGVAADQLEDTVQGDPPLNGWLGAGFQSDSNMDHCVSLCGYGTIEWLWLQLVAGGTPPSVGSVDAPAYALFTWGSIGIIDVPSLLAICGEAWLRNPATIVA